MRSLRITLLLLAVLSVAACGDDDEDVMMVCTQSTWVGTYSGTGNCDGTEEDVEVTITASGTDAIIIQYVSGSTTTTYDPITVTDCIIDIDQMDATSSVSLDVELDGNALTLREAISASGITSDCSIVATRN